MRKPSLLLIAALIALITTPATAQELDEREHVDVFGAAEIKVVPDEFVVRATVASFDASLEKGSKQNEAAIARIFKGVTGLGVARRYVVTDEVSVDAVTEGHRERGNYRRLGYTVSRDVMIVLHDARRVEPVIKHLFEVGVDRLTMSKGHTEMAELVENAQIQAANAAKRKATLYSSALGRQLGEAVSVSEEAQHRAAPQNFVYTADTPDLGDTISLGKIRVQASVRVKFLLR